jgi:hypothetical protein
MSITNLLTVSSAFTIAIAGSFFGSRGAADTKIYGVSPSTSICYVTNNATNESNCSMTNTGAFCTVFITATGENGYAYRTPGSFPCAEPLQRP